MRSWYPIPPQELDNKRLLGEHNELLIMARSIFGLSKGWKNHPETNRWRGHSVVMKKRHDDLAEEMIRRGMNHRSPWPSELVNNSEISEPPLWESVEVMKHKLHLKQQ